MAHSNTLLTNLMSQMPRQLNRAHDTGNEIMFDSIINPNNQAEVEALSRAIGGDFSARVSRQYVK